MADINELTPEVDTQASKPTEEKEEKKRTFKLVEYCRILCTQIVSATAHAPVEYRPNICMRVQELSYELIHTVRHANSLPLGEERSNLQEEASEIIEKLFDLIPVVRRCKCITKEQEEEINNKLVSLKKSFKNWTKTNPDLGSET